MHLEKTLKKSNKRLLGREHSFLFSPYGERLLHDKPNKIPVMEKQIFHICYKTKQSQKKTAIQSGDLSRNRAINTVAATVSVRRLFSVRRLLSFKNFPIYILRPFISYKVVLGYKHYKIGHAHNLRCY